jgi:hypothetical protein
MRALVLLPETVELVYGGLAHETPFDEKATHHCASAADARATMDIDAPARLQRIMHAVEDLGHVRTLRRGAVILDRLAEILDAEREFRVVGLQLTRLSEVDETLDARSHEALQSLARGITVRATRVLAGQHLTRQHPVAVTERSWFV